MKKLLFLIIIICTYSLCYSELRTNCGICEAYQPAEISSGTAFASLKTNYSRYSPGDTVNITALFNTTIANGTLEVKYYHLADSIQEQVINITGSATAGWQWVAPASDYRGYLVQVLLEQGGQVVDTATIGVDVSSNWKYFPRYGFVSSYPRLSSDSIASVIETLNRYHINGVQFYDWQYKHNMPLDGTPDSPATYWRDIANRLVYFSTVKGYIDEVHKHNMLAMSYNLLYGAYSNSSADGVKDEWGLYTDANHTTRYMYTLPTGWASNLYFMDPSNKDWQAYIIGQERKVFQALPFDGWHVDQVGDPGTVYNYYGKNITVSDTFYDFLKSAKDSLNVDFVMNAVNQYGQTGIAVAPVDFLYSEVWSPNDSFSDLVNIISRNRFYSSNKLNSTLAAYVNYNLANNTGYFNTPGVILLDAVIFAAGGSHLELGEHMLGKEYFPNSNLQMTDDLKKRLVHYYDFLVSYENLLRDNVKVHSVNLVSTSNIKLSYSSINQSTVWYYPILKGNSQIIHLINLLKANSVAWRDANGTQVEPDNVYNLSFRLHVDSTVKRIWYASPDFGQCSPVELQFTESNDSVNFTVPQLKYWDMIVIEYSESTSSIGDGGNNLSGMHYSLGQNYPNPFNPTTTINYSLPKAGFVKLKVFDILGNEVETLVNEEKPAGNFSVKFPSQKNNLASGIYIYELYAGKYFASKKLILLK
jgi:dextranase